MNFWSPKTLKSLVLPGGIFLLAASVVFRGAFGPIPSAAVVFSFYAVFAAGILLAWRFHSSRILFALATLFLAHRALEHATAALDLACRRGARPHARTRRLEKWG